MKDLLFLLFYSNLKIFSASFEFPLNLVTSKNETKTYIRLSANQIKREFYLITQQLTADLKVKHAKHQLNRTFKVNKLKINDSEYNLS